MIKILEELYKEGLERYKVGEKVGILILLFKEIIDCFFKSSSSWISLLWLYLLEKKFKLVYKVVKEGFKFNLDDLQGRINLVLVMLEIEKKGVRFYVEKV